jgi:hypothetical protein
VEVDDGSKAKNIGGAERSIQTEISDPFLVVKTMTHEIEASSNITTTTRVLAPQTLRAL